MSNAPEPYPGEFLRSEVGSVLYGLNLPGLGDMDLMGVRVEGMDEMVRLGAPFEQHVWRSAGGQNPSRAGDIDFTCYGLAKFLRLAVKGNPTILTLLFVPRAMCHLDGALADELRALTTAIVSRDAAKKFLGYMHSQRQRLEGVRGQKHTGADRKKYYVQTADDPEPWDGKYGAHIIRLGCQGLELMATERMMFPMEEPTRSRILSIRQGKMSKADVIEWAMELERGLFAYVDGRITSPLPDFPDTEAVDAWMRSVYLGHWANRVRYVPGL